MAMNLVSVVIATFNSQRTLPLVLASIRKQSYPQKDIEILIIDGGSTDNTCAIAKKFRCRIIGNPKVEPEYAKYLGYLHARGKYILYIDHDEILINKNGVEMRINVLKENPRVKVVIASGYRSPVGYHVINKYINEFGDPFSFFMYRLSKNPNFFLRTMQARYHVVKDVKDYVVVDLASSEVPLIEITAAATIIDGNFFKKIFPETKIKYYLIDHLLHLLRSSYPTIAILKNDVVLHYSSDTLSSYLQKIVWRVKNNIFYTSSIGAAGFYGRQDYGSSAFRMKKHLFLPYACTLVGPSVDALYLMITRRDLSYAIHVPLTLLTSLFIVYYELLKVVGVHPALTSYDGSVPAYEKK